VEALGTALRGLRLSGVGDKAGGPDYLLQFLESRPLGGTFTLDALWRRLGIDTVLTSLNSGPGNTPRRGRPRATEVTERVLFGLVANRALEPYYVMMRLPDQAQAEYLLIQPFTPRGKQNMVSWLAVRNDAPNYGQAVVFELPKDRTIFGPQQVAALIQNTPEYSRDVSLLNQQGSSVVQGNLLVVPIGNTFIYFQPIYLKSSQTQTIPELKKVLLVHRDQVVYANTLQDALAVLLGTAPNTTPPTNNPPPTTTNQTVQQLAQLALQHYNQAQADLKNGDLAGYANEMNQVGQILQQIVAATGGAPTTTPSPSPGTSPSPRASPSP